MTKVVRLNLGCGRDIRDGYLNIDAARLPGVSLVADLNRSLPFKDASIDEILMDSVLEHLDDVSRALGEVFRVLRRGGTVLIVVPHAYSLDALRDPTHRHFFVYGTFDFFIAGHHRDYYFDFAFSSARRRIVFSQSNMFSRFLARAANRRPWLYENTVLRAFPCLGLEVELTK